VRLLVTDSQGDTGEATMVIAAGNTPPTAVIDTPPAGTTWAVQETIAFSGHASDSEEGTLPESALSWSIVLHHCPFACHKHPIQTLSGTASGGFVAPNHGYPSHFELQLTATDARGLQHTTTLQLHPRTRTLTLASDPSGLNLVAGTVSGATPFGTTVIEGSTITVTAPSPQTLGESQYQFASWSDGGAQTHSVVVPEELTLTATYQVQGP
jgi:hypothetical protein